MKAFTDQEMEVQIGHMLRFGVTLAAIVVFFGGIFYLLHSSGPVPDYSHFHGTPEQLRTLAGVVRGAIHLNAESVIQLGILLLIATPVTRVAFCVWGFTRQRDRLYVAVSSVVFLILIYSLVRGGR